MVAGRLSTDLARLRDELESQLSDLKRFHDLSVRLSSNLELQRLLNDVLTSIAALQKTDLGHAPAAAGALQQNARGGDLAGFTRTAVKSFGELPASFFFS